MPIEALSLEGQPCKFESCPRCHSTPFDPLMRGMVVRSRWSFAYLRHWFCGGPWEEWALICYECNELVGYEAVPSKKA